ncbi:SAC3/GANP/Nin1/mts3/eIF-3 p25 family-domain-containing protein [Coniochaeta sp. 2T2.1]|nr:SAC3/GANP/Nin1/mts3/eIF-3 p25 family-domain-containing protein [Coniochaeta sp. 2T2.1]
MAGVKDLFAGLSISNDAESASKKAGSARGGARAKKAKPAKKKSTTSTITKITKKVKETTKKGEATVKDRLDRLRNLLPSLDPTPVRKIKKRPGAFDCAESDDKGENTTSSTSSTSDNTTSTPLPGPAATPVPLATSSDDDKEVEDLGELLRLQSLVDQAKSSAERFEPVSTPLPPSPPPKSPAERFKPVSLQPTTSPTSTSSSSSSSNNGSQATEASSSSAPTLVVVARSAPVSFGNQFRERPSGNDSDDDDEDEKEEKRDEYKGEEEDQDPQQQQQQQQQPSVIDQDVEALTSQFRRDVEVEQDNVAHLLCVWDENPSLDPTRTNVDLSAFADWDPAPTPAPPVQQPVKQAVKQPVVQQTDDSDTELSFAEELRKARRRRPPAQEAKDVELVLGDREGEQPTVVQPPVQVAVNVEVEISGNENEQEEVVGDVEMTSGGNPSGGVPSSGAPSSSAPMFGGPSVPTLTSPFAQGSSSGQQSAHFQHPQPSQPSQPSHQPPPSMAAAFAGSPFGSIFANRAAAASSTTTGFGATPFGQPSQTAANTAASPFGAPSSNQASQQPSFGAPSIQSTSNQQQSQHLSPFGASSNPAFSNQVPQQPSPFGAPSNPNLANKAPSSGPAANPFGQPPKQPSPSPIVNPFAPSSNQPQQPQQAASSNPPAPGTTSSTGIFAKAPSDGAGVGVTKPNPFDSLKNLSAASSQLQANQQSGAPKPNPFNAFNNQQRQPSPAAAPVPAFGGAASKKAVHFSDNVQTNNFSTSASPAMKMGNGQQDRFAPQPSEGTGKLSSLAVEYANKVNARLRNDGITAPKWPSDPGNPSQRPAMEKLKEQYKKHRARAYDALRKAEIIDDPERKRRLEDALTFKGICEDMCPDYEQVTRICEYDVKKEEKRPSPSGGDPWPEPSKMVKKFARSAAGMEEPLPMDVRSFDALKRSTDYLLGDLLKTDDQLPSLHGYLWDRTRAVRKDFSFHSQKSSEEMQVMVYILEAIARFHVISLHLLSRKGFALDDFDQQQEVAQLGATLLSLKETYDDCRQRNVVCENEGEFRALYFLLNMHSPNIMEESLEWTSLPWYNSTHMETARSLFDALQSFDQAGGPFKPYAIGAHFAAPGFTRFFDLVGSKTVSYTMACLCEVHFTWLRQRILGTLVKGFARRRDWPKDITPRILNRMLRFDTDEEAVEFVKLHDFDFETRRVDGRQEQFLLLKSKRQHVPSPRVPQSHSATIVEAKRNGQPLPEVFRRSIYGDKDIEFNDGESERSHILSSDNIVDNIDSDDGDDMFVGQSSQKTVQPTNGINGKQPETKQNPFAAKPSPFASNSISFGSPSVTQEAPTNGPSAAKPSLFAPGSNNAASNPFQSSNGVSQNGATTAPAAQPLKPAASPFMQGSVKPAVNPFASSTPVIQQPATNNTPSAPAPEPAKAPEANASSFFGAAQKQAPAAAPAASVFADTSKTSTQFKGFGTSSQASTPAAATPSTVDKDTSTTGAKTSTPASVFSSLTAEKATPPSGSFFPTSTPAAPATSNALPAASSTTPATSIFSATGSVDTTKSTPAASSTTSIFSQPETAKVTTSAPTQEPKQSQSKPAAPSQNVAPPSKSSAAAPSSVPQNLAPPKQQPSEPMAEFTKWFVTGDGGLIEEFTEFTVENILADTFAQFQQEEAERIAREEDEASWAAAREHMAYRLQVKFFYRWRTTARELAMQRRLREGKAKYKAAMEAKEKAKWEKMRAEKKAAERKKRDEIREREERLRNFTAADELVAIIQEEQRSRQSSTEDALLATGVFAGVRGSEREVARQVVKEAHLPRRPTSSQSSISMAPPVIKPPPIKEGWKTRSIREKLGLGSSRRESFSSSSTNNFSQSLPVNGGKAAKPVKVTNFSASTSRKRSADTSDDEPDAKKNKILKSGYSLHWELRRRGLIQMPDGQWLPERIAKQMYEGKRFSGYGNCGLGPGKVVPTTPSPPPAVVKQLPLGHEKKSKTIPAQPAPASTPSTTRQSKLDALAAKFGFPPTKRYTQSRRESSSSTIYRPALTRTPVSSSSPPTGGGGKRKRDADDHDAEGSPDSKKANVAVLDDDASDEDSGSEAGMTSKQKTERALAKMSRRIRELNESMDVLDKEERPWMREQIRRMAAGDGGEVRDEGGL